MITFNKEQMEILKEHEQQLFRATYQDYYRSTNTKLLEQFKQMYDSVSKEPWTGNWSCGHCVLSFLKAVGNIYFNTKKQIEEKASQLVEALDEVFEVKKPEPKKTSKPATRKNNKPKSKK